MIDGNDKILVEDIAKFLRERSMRILTGVDIRSSYFPAVIMTSVDAVERREEGIAKTIKEINGEYDELVGEICSQIKPDSVGLYIQIAQQCMKNRDYNSASAVLDAIEMAMEKKQIKNDDLGPDDRRALNDAKESFKMHFDTSRVLVNAGRDVIPVMRDDKNKEPLCGDN